MRSRGGKVRLKTSPQVLRQAGILLADLPPGAPGQAPPLLDLPGIFANRRPVEVEIGPGKGGFLIARAARRPEINLLGIEWLFSYACYAADRASRAELTNVRLLCAEAGEVFAHHLPDQSVWRVHIYFPDPWPKKRHHRRRLITPAFLADARRALKLGGELRIVTDHEDYFQHIRGALDQTAGLAQVACRGADPGGADCVETNFQRKYAARGKTFHAVAAIRCR